MRLLLVNNYVKDQQFSMQKFAELLANSLGAEVIVDTLSPPAVFGTFAKSTVSGFGKWFGYVDKYLLFPPLLFLKSFRYDLIHICDHSNAVYVPFLGWKPHLVTCHDLMAVRSSFGDFHDEVPVGFMGRLLQRSILKGLINAHYVVCVSGATRCDLMRLSARSEDKTFVIQNALNYPYTPMPQHEAWAIICRYGIAPHTRFLLHVGGNQWYKNRLGVVKIFASLLKNCPDSDLCLVLIGKPVNEEVASFIRLRSLQSRVLNISGLDSEEIRGFYSAAEALLFPSLLEGFGWPVIEAQACGCPVITSNRSPMTEVAGDGALFVDPVDHESAAAEVKMLLDSPNKLMYIKKHGLLNVADYQPGRMAAAYLSTYSLLLNREFQA